MASASPNRRNFLDPKATFMDLEQSLLLGSIDRAIRQLTQQQQEATRQETFRNAPLSGEKQTDEARFADLGETLLRLQQIKAWLQADQRLLPIIDEYIGMQVRSQARKDRRQSWAIAAATTIIGALLGWLLSALLPASLIVTNLRP
jgi:hypothetical protein